MTTLQKKLRRARRIRDRHETQLAAQRRQANERQLMTALACRPIDGPHHPPRRHCEVCDRWDATQTRHTAALAILLLLACALLTILLAFNW